MRNVLIIAAVSFAAAAVVGGCASSPKPKETTEFKQVRAIAFQRTELPVQWNTGSDDDKAAADAVREMLRSELSIDAAVGVALLNNQNLQAEFEELGIAQADLVQAGLLTNPVFSGSVRFPDGGGRSNLELSISASFIELLSMPMRKKIATAELAAAKSRAANAVLELVADVRKAYYELQAAQQRVELQKTVLTAMKASSDAAGRIHAAGNMNDLDLANENALAAQSELDLLEANAAVVEHREHLNVLMGLTNESSDWTIAGRLPELPARDTMDGLDALALRQRLDLVAAGGDVEVAARTLGISRPLGIFGDTEVGVSAEREVEGGWVTGPELSLPIPLFDQGQGAVAKASAQLRQAQRRYNALAVQVRSDVRGAVARVRSARTRAESFQRTVLPLRRKITEQTQLHYNGMFVGIFQLLEAKAAEVEAGQQYVEAMRDYWVAMSDLERAIGGRMPSLRATTMPTTQP